MVLFRQRDVLHSPMLRARHLMHRPLRPAIEPGQILRSPGLFVAPGQGQEWGHGINVLRGRPFGEAIGKPAVDNIAHRRVPSLLVVLMNTVQTYAMRPLPTGPPFGINDPPVVQPQQKRPRFIANIDQIMGHFLDQRLQFMAANKMRRLTQ